MTRIALGISLATIAILWWALVESVRKGRELEATLKIQTDPHRAYLDRDEW